MLVALIGMSALAVSGRMPGRAGLWLEISLANLLSYLAGCVIGGMARGLWRRIPGRSNPAMPPA